MDAILNYIIITGITGVISYLIYIHRCINQIEDRQSLRYTKAETEHLIDLKLKPLSDRTIILEDRLERLERKIDRILEALSHRG